MDKIKITVDIAEKVGGFSVTATDGKIMLDAVASTKGKAAVAASKLIKQILGDK